MMRIPVSVKSTCCQFILAMGMIGFVSPMAPADDSAKDFGKISAGTPAQAGLVAKYRSLSDPKAVFSRIEAKPSFFLGRSSPDPRIPPGAFEIVWTGVIDLAASVPVSFDAFVSGELSIDIDGVRALEGRGANEFAMVGPGKPLDRPGGMYPIRIVFRSIGEQPTRLQIWWQGPSFAREPLPAWRLKHVATDLPAQAAEERIAEAGRIAVASFGRARCHSSVFPGIHEPPPEIIATGRDENSGRSARMRTVCPASRVKPG